MILLEKYSIVTGTITYAIRGRDILRKHGFRANMEKTKSNLNHGCGYSISVSGNIDEITEILRNSAIKILDIIKQ